MADDDTPMAEFTTLDDARVMFGGDHVVLAMAVVSDDGGVEFVKVRMPADDARRIGADLIARAERVDRERS
jgi:hypothetical protein